ncbi:two pore domain potassium channel family protein [Pseudalkalibacillus hwajinpoensis]|uniref:Two pore domain potassium channel family protein n=2 Tax=Guptibacillus hwajinpoensis TaxID=208199 RepID=A0A4V5PZ54_9BACL|nr:potassium channel family protein [Pseudalkalibacillus hwajinpoensis]TKD72658.1 two pore domain potassium channel family protein [Pseudalkalibacillus hwajinpoensis]
MINFLIGATILFIAINLFYFFSNKTYKKSTFSSALFLKLFFVLLGVLVGFTFLYYLLSMKETIIVQSLSSRKPIEPTLLNLFYFSGETLLSVGYGDILPIGPARFFAIIESMIGILLPTAYFMKAIDLSNQSKHK